VKILAVDTATPLCGVAVLSLENLREGAVRERAAVRQARVTTHSERLLPLIGERLGELGLRPEELSGVACGVGPGSFTGLRIGLSTAKGLCFALGLPLVLVSSLEALAARGLCTQPAPARRPVLAVLPAFRGQVFARLLVKDSARSPAVAAALEACPELGRDGVFSAPALAAAVAGLQPIIVGQSGPWGSAAESGGDDVAAPHPLDVARLGAERLLAGEVAPLHAAVPNYLAVSAAEEALGSG
jgi:tRNA threonylcarbamoyladenosine biosynthesis protein TsaB